MFDSKQHVAARVTLLGVKHLNIHRTTRYAGRYSKSLIKGWYIAKIEEKIAEPFQEVLQGRHVLPKPIKMIETLEKMHECHGNIEGEFKLGKFSHSEKNSSDREKKLSQWLFEMGW